MQTYTFSLALNYLPEFNAVGEQKAISKTTISHKESFFMEKAQFQKYIQQEFIEPVRTKPMDPVARTEILIFEAQSIVKTTIREHARREFIKNMNA